MNDTPPETAKRSLPFRILSLDGGGAKGFYTLGVLDEIERNTGRPLCETFDLIFGTSTGAIIAALVARGEPVEKIMQLYREHVPSIMTPVDSKDRSAALKRLAAAIFADTKVTDFKTAIGVVATNWRDVKPMIFKASVAQAHGSTGSFVPFWGCSVADAVIASCSAYPFFETHSVTTSKGDIIEVADGGFCANNPTLYALADATIPLGYAHEDVRVVSVGVGAYPAPTIWKKIKKALGGWGMIRHSLNVDFLQKILDTNTGSMDQLRFILFKKVPTVRISESFVEPEMATDLLEHDLGKLNRLVQKGRISYQRREVEIKTLLEP